MHPCIAALDHLVGIDLRREDGSSGTIAAKNTSGTECIAQCRTESSPRRMAGYIGRAIEQHGVPVFSSVIYLRPDAGRRDPGVRSGGVRSAVGSRTTLISIP